MGVVYDEVQTTQSKLGVIRMENSRFRVVAGSAVLLSVVVTITVAQVMRPAPVLHDLAGRDNCLMCHSVGAMEMVTDVPANHVDRENVTCLWCHGPQSAMLTTVPPQFAHDTAGRDNCLMCHAPGAMDPVPDTPDDHEGRESTHCLMCHQQAD